MARVILASGFVETWLSLDGNGVEWLNTGVVEPEGTFWEAMIQDIDTGWVMFPGGDRMFTSPDLRVWTPVDTSVMGIKTVGRSRNYSRVAYGFEGTIKWELDDSVDGRETWIMELVR